MKGIRLRIVAVAVLVSGTASGEPTALLGRRRSDFTLFSPDPSILIWDNIVEGGFLNTTGLHGWLKVPMSHDASVPADDRPPHVCLRVSAHSRSRSPRLGPLLAHCGGPGSGRECALAAMSDMRSLADDFFWLGIDQRGLPLTRDRDGSDSSVAECPFEERSGEPIRPFPAAFCDEIASRLENLTSEEQVERMREIRMEFMVGGALPRTDDEMQIVFAILGRGLNNSTIRSGTWFRNETYIRWFYRLVQFQQNLCIAAPRFGGHSASGRPYNVLAYVGTRELVRDLDLLRQAIGADKMSLYGESYGTSVASAYATQFPYRVDRLVMDAVVPPTRDLLGTLDDLSKGVFSVLNGIMTDCSLSVYQGFPEDDRCPLAPGPSSKYAEMLADSGNPARQDAATREALEMSWDVYRAPLAVDCLSRRYEGRPLADYCFQDLPAHTEPIARGEIAVTVDIPVDASGISGRLSEEAFVAWWRSSLVEFPTGFIRAMSFAAGVGSWPLYPKPLPPPGSASIPALVVGNLHDVDTDYRGAQGMRASYPAAALVTWQGYGHTLLGAGTVPGTVDVQIANEEARERCLGLVTSYLSSGVLPDDGHVCALRAPLSLGYNARKRTML